MLSWYELSSGSMATINGHRSFHFMPAKDVPGGLLRLCQFEKEVWILVSKSQI